MRDKLLHVYLNDHLAGSVSAVELIERLLERTRGTRLGGVLEELLQEIRKDQAVLEELLARVGGSQSAVKQAGAWLLEKVGRLKFSSESERGRQLDLFEALEALVLGIHGKEVLWRALAVVLCDDARLRDFDFSRLAERAKEQHDRVERLRLEVAQEVFSRGDASGAEHPSA